MIRCVSILAYREIAPDTYRCQNCLFKTPSNVKKKTNYNIKISTRNLGIG